MERFCRCIGLGGFFPSNSFSSRHVNDLSARATAFISPAAEQRVQEANVMAWNARLTWIIIHVVFISFIFMLDSEIVGAFSSKTYWYIFSYFGILILTIVMYYFTCISTPGYVYEILPPSSDVNDENQESINQNISRSKSLPSFDSKLNLTMADVVCEETPLLCKKEDSNSNNPNSNPNNPNSNSNLDSPTAKSRGLKQSLHFNSSSNLLTNYERHSLRKCPYCLHYQLMRSKHCHDCSKCVLKFDHHCFWLGTCIGQYNHRTFWWYLFFECILIIWNFYLSLTSIHSATTAYVWIEDNIFSILVALPLFGFGAFVISLFTFHSYLALTNQTTYEFTRRKRISYLRELPVEIHPFDAGWLMNIYYFCSANYPDYDHLSQKVSTNGNMFSESTSEGIV